MEIKNKSSFWQALFSATILFIAGLVIGVYLENYRGAETQEILLNSEINILDSKIMGEISETFDIDCEKQSEKISEFADNIYYEAILLEKYDSSSSLTKITKSLHRKYDLLRLILWKDATELKKRCPSNFHTIVYLYQFENPSNEVKSKQIAFSRYLSDIKDKYGAKIILIPIAGDTELNSIDLIKDKYELKNYPLVIIDETTLIREIEDLTRIEQNIDFNWKSNIPFLYSKYYK